MAVLKRGESHYPFWGSSINLITGLDPLSLQTTSEATYATMLPGISNLTNRMRYYGFYCWLLKFYFETQKEGSSKDQNRFIRRAELMIALIMQSRAKEITQITGSDFASDMIETSNTDYYDLAEGADKDGKDKKVYWKYSSGAFGQYYYGSMRAISLVVSASNESGDTIFKISEPHPKQKVSGQQLAAAFETTLNAEAKKLFLRNIDSGKLYKRDIDILFNCFAINRIPSNSPEWNLYVDLLLDKDDPSLEIEDHFSFHRRETIRAIIENANANNKKYDWYAFLLETYKFKLSSNSKSETNIGWYCYMLNEYWQYACVTLLWSVLQNLNHLQREQYLPSFVENLKNEIAKIVSERINPSGSKTKTVIDSLSQEYSEETLYEKIESSGYDFPVDVAADAFILLLVLYKNNKEELPQLKDFMRKKGTVRDGNMVDGLMLIHEFQDEEVPKLIEQFILKKIIYRHQMVALRKMGNGSQATYKFILEEQYIRYIENFEARMTSPRMNALQNLLSDLNVVDSNNEVTDLSQKFA